MSRAAKSHRFSSALTSLAVLLVWPAVAWANDSPGGHFQPLEELETVPVTTFSRSEPVRLQLETVRPDKPVVGLVVNAPAQAAYITLNSTEKEIQRLPGGNQQWVWLDVPTTEPLRLVARAFLADGTPLAESSPVVVDPRDYAPAGWQLAATPNRVTDKLDRLSLIAPPSSETAAWVEVLVDGKPVHHVMDPQPGELSIPTQMLPKGKHEVRLVTRNTWGSHTSKPMVVYNLGVQMPGPTYVLVDKYNLTLYYVKDNQLKEVLPIAIGRPRTPTPTGMFILSKKERMGNPYTGWGVLRMLLYRNGHWSGYAIHGTNNPASIGTEASHGCVRMFNQDVTRLSQQIPLPTPVLIKERLEVDIDEIRPAAGEE